MNCNLTLLCRPDSFAYRMKVAGPLTLERTGSILAVRFAGIDP